MAAYPEAPATYISLFSGIGALDLAVRRVFPGARCLVLVEREAPAVATLAARMEAGDLDAAPVWGDVCTLPTGALRGRVDLVVGGFPCQDISLAGKGAGLAGARSGLFFNLMDIVCDVRPRFVFLENVAAITVRGLDAVLGSLAESGFDAEWGCLKASDVGAPHGRDRWWLLAWDRSPFGVGLADPKGVRRWTRRSVDSSATGRAPAGAPWGRSETVADAERGRHDGGASEPGRESERRVAAARPGEAVGDAHHAGLEGRRLLGDGCTDECVARTAGRPSNGWPGFPPGPEDRDGWRRYLACYPDLAPATERAVRGSADGTTTRVDRLRGLGNAVVPQQADAALRALWFRAFGERL